MDPFVAEIRAFPFNFAPKGWARCDGQILPIAQNTALFALLGTTYGGDGKSTFALPDLRGRVPLQHGQGSGLSARYPGQEGGVESVALIGSEMPSHTHQLAANAGDVGDVSVPGPSRSLAASAGGALYQAAPATVTMAPGALLPTGHSMPHNNMQPSLVLTFCIALQGVFPQRW